MRERSIFCCISSCCPDGYKRYAIGDECAGKDIYYDLRSCIILSQLQSCDSSDQRCNRPLTCSTFETDSSAASFSKSAMTRPQLLLMAAFVVLLAGLPQISLAQGLPVQYGLLPLGDLTTQDQAGPYAVPAVQAFEVITRRRFRDQSVHCRGLSMRLQITESCRGTCCCPWCFRLDLLLLRRDRAASMQTA